MNKLYYTVVPGSRLLYLNQRILNLVCAANDPCPYNTPSSFCQNVEEKIGNVRTVRVNSG